MKIDFTTLFRGLYKKTDSIEEEISLLIKVKMVWKLLKNQFTIQQTVSYFPELALKDTEISVLFHITPLELYLVMHSQNFVLFLRGKYLVISTTWELHILEEIYSSQSPWSPNKNR